MVLLYMVTFTINISPMLAYIPYMDPMGNDDSAMDLVYLIFKETHVDPKRTSCPDHDRCTRASSNAQGPTLQLIPSLKTTFQ